MALKQISSRDCIPKRVVGLDFLLTLMNFVFLIIEPKLLNTR
jgi:hypothetical protein